MPLDAAAGFDTPAFAIALSLSRTMRTPHSTRLATRLQNTVNSSALVCDVIFGALIG